MSTRYAKFRDLRKVYRSFTLFNFPPTIVGDLKTKYDKQFFTIKLLMRHYSYKILLLYGILCFENETNSIISFNLHNLLDFSKSFLK